jgi:hypothetical protein
MTDLDLHLSPSLAFKRLRLRQSLPISFDVLNDASEVKALMQ